MSNGGITEHALAAVVGPHLDGEVNIHGLERLTGGASRETWAFSATGPDGTTRRLILRREPPGTPAFAPVHVPEFDILLAATAAGVPVPHPLFALSEDDGLGGGYVMDHVEGETLGKRVVHEQIYAEARPRLAHQCGVALAHIHSIDLDRFGLRERLPGRGQTALDQLRELEAILDALEVARPILEVGLAWLRDHVPDDAPQRLVHGDFRVGNLIVGPGGLRAVLDWELAHLGNPAEDLGWLCVRAWRFGGAGRVGGCGDVHDLLRGYREGGGNDIPMSDLHFWEVFGTLRWGIICAVQAAQHLSGARRSVELAAIGRRICEVEYDLMGLLEEPLSVGPR